MCDRRGASGVASRVSIVVAMSQNHVIGRAGELPWRLPGDLQYFKQLTMGKPIVMGRKTHVSIGRPLPGRLNIVVSRDPDYRASGCVHADSFDAALLAAGDANEIMIIGGAALFLAALPLAHCIYMTEVHAVVSGDTKFPALERSQWREVSRQWHPRDENNDYDYSFVVLERITTDALNQ